MSRPAITMRDAELVVVEALRGRVTATIGTRVPSGNLPVPFVLVRRVGGTMQTLVGDGARIDLIVWHDSDHARMALAQQCRALIHAHVGSDGVQRVTEFLGPTRVPDPANPDAEVVLLTLQVTVRAT